MGMKITDNTMRDGHQSLLATRMRTEDMLPIAEEMDEAGFHSVRWDSKDNGGNPVSSGVYLYRLQAGSFSQTKKMLLIR